MGEQSRIPLDVEWIAKQLLAGMPIAWAADRIVRDVLVLEDAGHVVTWAQDGREWLALHRSGPAAPQPAPGRPGASCAPPSGPIFIGLEERERERERASTHEQARERARARAEAERLESSGRWELEYSKPRPRKPPRRPRILDAPPRGCPDHPNGTISEECGPCGTAADIRKTWLANEKYLDELVLFEESQQQQWEDMGSDTF